MPKRDKPTIDTISVLRFKLTELWDDIIDEQIEDSKAKLLNATAQNIIRTVSVQNNHAETNGLIAKIDFMESDYNRPKLKPKQLSK